MGVFTQFVLFTIVKYKFYMSRTWLLDLYSLRDFSKALDMSLVTKMVVLPQFMLFFTMKYVFCMSRKLVFDLCDVLTFNVFC